MKDFIEKYKIFLSVFVYVLILMLGYVFVVAPSFSKIDKKNSEIQEKIAKQENDKEKISKLPSFKSQFEMIANEEEKVKIGVSKDNVVALLEKIEKISGETGNRVKIEIENTQDQNKKDVSKSKEKEDDVKEEKKILENLPLDRFIKINIVLTGSYQNLISFLNKIENADYYSDIISIKISKDSEKNFSNNPFDNSKITNTGNQKESEKNELFSRITIVFYLDK